jgi:hypothetical protein
MGPKKKGGSEGKKVGKASKLAKMNEQERAKYLERKMAEEEEVKRRKEEMITVFMKVSFYIYCNQHFFTVAYLQYCEPFQKE